MQCTEACRPPHAVLGDNGMVCSVWLLDHRTRLSYPSLALRLRPHDLHNVEMRVNLVSGRSQASYRATRKDLTHNEEEGSIDHSSYKYVRVENKMQPWKALAQLWKSRPARPQRRAFRSFGGYPSWSGSCVGPAKMKSSRGARPFEVQPA